MSQWMLSEFQCADCGVFEELIAKPVPDEHDCPTCGALSPWVMSAPMGKVSKVSVERGSSAERPPNALDTRALADGMSYGDWKAREDKKDRDWRWKKNTEALK